MRHHQPLSTIIHFEHEGALYYKQKFVLQKDLQQINSTGTNI